MKQNISNASHVNINNLTTSHVNGNAESIGRSVESKGQGFRLLLDNISRGPYRDAAKRGGSPRTAEGIPSAPESHSEERFTTSESSPQSLNNLLHESDKNEKKKKRTLFWGNRDKHREEKMDQERLEKETHQAQVPGKDYEHERGREGRRENDGFADLTGMIGYLIATASKDWALIHEVCDRASASVNDARKAVQVLQREFKYGNSTAQLYAIRLWAIMLRNSSPTFISQSTTYNFMYTIEDLLDSSKTSPVIRERLLEVVAAAAYASGNDQDPRYKRSGFKGLWKRVKPDNKPDEGEPFDVDYSDVLELEYCPELR